MVNGRHTREDLLTEEHLTTALDWLDQQTGWPDGAARAKLTAHLEHLDERRLRDRARLRRRVRRDQVARALAAYYAEAADGFRTYRVRCGPELLSTSLLTRPDWLGLSLPYGTAFNLTDTRSPRLPMDATGSRAAVEWLAEAVTGGHPTFNAPLYRMTGVDLGGDTVGAGFGAAEFVEYALSMRLLERELLDAIVDGRAVRPGALPLRDHYLPDRATVTHPSVRLCGGGPLALCAVARESDYVVLVRESENGRLTLVPQTFHEPATDFEEDVSVAATLRRELAEVLGEAPMAWLAEHPGRWRVECTGFGFELVSGDFAFASLIVVDDAGWWDGFGARLPSGLRAHSTRDPEGLAELLCDPGWSSEGLFALAEGLRRLSAVGGDRVRLPRLRPELG
ncbi:hypothetical protein [Nonomuraea longicatena]